MHTVPESKVDKAPWTCLTCDAVVKESDGGCYFVLGGHQNNPCGLYGNGEYTEITAAICGRCKPLLESFLTQD